MNRNQEELIKLFKNSDVLKWMGRHFDRSFEIEISETEKDSSGQPKIRIKFKRVDSGLPVMTVADVAAFLQTDRASVRRMTGARAQERSKHPIPFVKIAGKMLRFSRPAINSWWTELCADGKNPAPTLQKGRRK
ncbi:MAG: helix-turn-helix domain-containing protein [Terriglobales bacterium]